MLRLEGIERLADIREGGIQEVQGIRPTARCHPMAGKVESDRHVT